MLRIMFGISLLLSAGLAPAHSETPAGEPRTQTPGGAMAVPDQRADSSVARDGVIVPAPDAGRDATVKPPNVDPGMTIAPPGTPGGNRRVDPK